jgi:RNA polymerase sigma-70 factor (family 1)
VSPNNLESIFYLIQEFYPYLLLVDIFVSYQFSSVVKKDIIFEQLLVSRLRKGDPDSFSDIFSVYYKDLVHFAYTFIHDLQGAEDIVQDTYVWLWDSREDLNITVSLKSLLLKMIQNKCIDWHRHRKIMSSHIEYMVNSAPLYEYSTDNYLLRSEMEAIIEKALDQLPDNIIESYKMSRHDGLKYHEIAEKLDVSVRTVEVRISKALELLRKSFVDFL